MSVPREKRPTTAGVPIPPAQSPARQPAGHAAIITFSLCAAGFWVSVSRCVGGGTRRARKRAFFVFTFQFRCRWHNTPYRIACTRPVVRGGPVRSEKRAHIGAFESGPSQKTRLRNPSSCVPNFLIIYPNRKLIFVCSILLPVESRFLYQLIPCSLSFFLSHNHTL